MLVLERLKDEGIMIGGVVRVVIVGVTRGGKVKLGVDAPEGVEVWREEVVAARLAGKKGRRKESHGE